MTTYILGDIHGEYEIFVKLLKKVNLIEVNDEGLPIWREGCTDTLIQVGDMIDGCNGSISCYNLLKRLQEEATKEGGTVIRLIGNHELGYLQGFKDNWIHPTTDLVLKDVIKQDVLDGTLVATHILDDIIISHAGYTDNLPMQEWSAKDELTYAVRYNDFSSDIFKIGTSRLKFGGTSEIAGIFWADWRYDRLDSIKQIVGHTSVGKIECRGNHINVDCGISRHAQKVYQILKYENNEFSVINL